MYSFNFYMPTKVLFGPGKLRELHSEHLPGKKALIAIGGQSVKKYGYLETLEKTGIFFPSMFPTLSVVDSDLMMSVPSKLTAYQGMDAFFHASETVVNINHHPMAEMFALKTIEYVAKYLPRAVKDGNDKEARAYMALANTFAGYYMMCTSAHTMEHVMGSFHDNLIHGAGLIEIAHAYYDFFAEKKASEENMIKMAAAMGVSNPTSGKDFIAALDKLISDIGCGDLKMSDECITKEELKRYPSKVHEVLGGDITADPLPLSDDDYLTIFENAWSNNHEKNSRNLFIMCSATSTDHCFLQR